MSLSMPAPRPSKGWVPVVSLPRLLLGIAVLFLAGLWVQSPPVGTASSVTSFTVSLGAHGGARWTVGQSVYVNLRGMTPGTWKQQLWSGTCAVPFRRLAVLPGLIVSSSGRVAKTSVFSTDPGRRNGVVLRLLQGSAVVCASLVRAPVAQPTPDPTPSPEPIANLRGMNVVGMEMNYRLFDQSTGPVPNDNYPVLDSRLIDYLASKHVSVIRLLFSWEGMQSTLDGPIPASPTGLYGSYFDNYERVVNAATAKGIVVIVEPWQADVQGNAGGAMWRGQLVGSAAVPIAAFADFWGKMAGAFASNPLVQFGLVNEPNGMSTTTWWSAAQAAVTAIRGAGARQRILVPGNGYSAASTWNEGHYDTDPVQRSNAFGWLNAAGPGKSLTDPLANTVAEVHTYLDPDQGGRTTEISSVTAARDNLAPVVAEAERRGYHVFLGEIGFFADRTTDDGHPASDAWRGFVAYAKAHTDTLIGWTWWAAGQPGWWDDLGASGGGHFATTPSDPVTFTGDTVNMRMIESDF